jgi:hypothetical protein
MSKLDIFKNYLTVSEFVRRAYRELETLTNDEYHLRQGEGNGKLVEEILPLAAFLKHFERPGRSLKCRLFLGNQNYDAKILLNGYGVEKGYLEDSYFVEVTSAVSPQEYLKREALVRYGSFAGCSVRRVGSKKKGNDRIEGQGGNDIDSPVKDALEWTKNALKKKYDKKEPYPSPCMLVVQVEPDRPLNLHEWGTVVSGIQNTVDRDKFRATYIVNCWTNNVFEV